MRVLAIGGTGFIGSAAVFALRREGHEVTVFHRGQTAPPSGVPEILGAREDLPRFADRFRQLAPEVVLDTILSSGAQARALMSAFRGLARRVIALSSMDVYRACAILHGTEPGPLQPVPLKEDAALRTKAPYSADSLRSLRETFAWLDDEYDKVLVEREIMADAELPGTVLRLPMVYGPGDPLHRLFPILKCIEEDRPILLEEGMAQWRGPRGYVENVGAAIALAVCSERAAGRIYNVAEPENFSEFEWTCKVAEAAGWNGRILTVKGEAAFNTAQHWTADSTRIRNELGYREPVPVTEALRRTIAWERASGAGPPPQRTAV